MALWKDIVLWKYERASWQWDVLCLLIIAFIFLTPKTWFDERDQLATKTSRLIVKAADVSSDRSKLEQRVKDETGNPQAQIVSLKERRDPAGELFYEIEIR